MRQIYFTKLSGAGNDFILIDSKLNPDFSPNSQLIARFCDRRNGIGADGLILFSDPPGKSFGMTYFNSDGTTGSLCANGARCSLQYAFITGRIAAGPADFNSNGIDYSGEVLQDGNVRFYLKNPAGFKRRFKIKAGGQLITASYINTGSPHVVIKISDVLRDPGNPASNNYSIQDFPVLQLGREIRYSKDFAPEGTNVNFIENDGSLIKIRSYERGVENETLSCGTGAVASALVSFFNENVKPPFSIIPLSGDLLKVEFEPLGNEFNNISLTGPAEIVYKGEITI